MGTEMTDEYINALNAPSRQRESYEDKRRTQSLDSRRANIYRLISEVFDELGDEFLPAELYAKTGIRNVFANRILVASVLGDSFNCTIVGDFTPRRRWRKEKNDMDT